VNLHLASDGPPLHLAWLSSRHVLMTWEEEEREREKEDEEEEDEEEGEEQHEEEEEPGPNQPGFEPDSPYRIEPDSPWPRS
jgi:hypothetical protein